MEGGGKGMEWRGEVVACGGNGDGIAWGTDAMGLGKVRNGAGRWWDGTLMDVNGRDVH